MTKLTVVLVGPIASGKGSVAKFFKKKGFTYYTLSDVIREEAREKGLSDSDRKTLQDIGDSLRKEFGYSILAKRTAKKIKKDNKKKILIDSVRHPSEVKELKKSLNAKVIGIDATREKRFKNILKRGREGDPTTWEKFVKLDKREFLKDHRMQHHKCLEMADFVIKNEGTKKQLISKAGEILKSL